MPDRETNSTVDDGVRAVAEVVELIRGSTVRRVVLAVGDLRLEVDCAPVVSGVPQAMPVVAVEPVEQSGSPAEQSGMSVLAPLMGVFYSRPGPDQPPFVEIGQRVEAGQQLAIVEAMKMMNSVVADRAGRLSAVHVPDGEVVEFEQALMSVEPG